MRHFLSLFLVGVGLLGDSLPVLVLGIFLLWLEQ